MSLIICHSLLEHYMSKKKINHALIKKEEKVHLGTIREAFSAYSLLVMLISQKVSQ